MTDNNAFEGTLHAHWETGMDAHAWCIEETGKQGYEGLHTIEKGDLLTVFNDASKKIVIFQGEVEYDFDSNKKIRPIIGEVQWLKSVGHVHGVQKDFDGESWGRMFSQEKPAMLVKKSQP